MRMALPHQAAQRPEDISGKGGVQSHCLVINGVSQRVHALELQSLLVII